MTHWIFETEADAIPLTAAGWADTSLSRRSDAQHITRDRPRRDSFFNGVHAD